MAIFICPSCKTLMNVDDVENGFCENCGTSLVNTRYTLEEWNALSKERRMEIVRSGGAIKKDAPQKKNPTDMVAQAVEDAKTDLRNSKKLLNIKCQTCGGSDMIKVGDSYTCQYCGSKFIHDVERRVIVENDNTKRLENLIELGMNTSALAEITNIGSQILELDALNPFGWAFKTVGDTSLHGKEYFDDVKRCAAQTRRLAIGHPREDEILSFLLDIETSVVRNNIDTIITAFENNTEIAEYYRQIRVSGITMGGEARRSCIRADQLLISSAFELVDQCMDVLDSIPLLHFCYFGSDPKKGVVNMLQPLTDFIYGYLKRIAVYGLDEAQPEYAENIERIKEFKKRKLEELENIRQMILQGRGYDLPAFHSEWIDLDSLSQVSDAKTDTSGKNELQAYREARAGEMQEESMREWARRHRKGLIIAGIVLFIFVTELISYISYLM